MIFFSVFLLVSFWMILFLIMIVGIVIIFVLLYVCWIVFWCFFLYLWVIKVFLNFVLGSFIFIVNFVNILIFLMFCFFWKNVVNMWWWYLLFSLCFFVNWYFLKVKCVYGCGEICGKCILIFNFFVVGRMKVFYEFNFFGLFYGFIFEYGFGCNLNGIYLIFIFFFFVILFNGFFVKK